ncbi:MAG TPA: high-potential iron-sulfur protein [Castellaniella sp.]|jgi:hypothetical protein|nr:high-potential iron-sulfur protein [Castellaniella sp.]
MNTSRRTFLITSAGLASSLALSRQALAADHVDENSPLAKQLGYKHDASKIDAASQPKFKAGEHCANCQLYQGKAGDDWGPCPIFSGKDVSAKGWCSAYTPKA